jgi:hypothetical protein
MMKKLNYLLNAAVGLLSIFLIAGCISRNESPTFKVVGPRGELIKKVKMRDAKPEENYVVTIARKLSPVCSDLSAIHSTILTTNVIALDQYQRINDDYHEAKQLVSMLDRDNLKSLIWVRDTKTIYSMFLDEFNILVLENKQLKVSKRIVFMEGTKTEKSSELVGPYNQLIEVNDKLESLSEKITTSIMIFSSKVAGNDYTESQRKILQEIMFEAPRLEKELKEKYPDVKGAKEYVQQLSGFFLTMMMAANK